MALTATRVSPGIYTVNGKTIKAATSADAINAYQKQYGTTTTAPKTTTVAPPPPTASSTTAPTAPLYDPAQINAAIAAMQQANLANANQPIVNTSTAPITAAPAASLNLSPTDIALSTGDTSQIIANLNAQRVAQQAAAQAAAQQAADQQAALQKAAADKAAADKAAADKAAADKAAADAAAQNPATPSTPSNPPVVTPPPPAGTTGLGNPTPAPINLENPTAPETPPVIPVTQGSPNSAVINPNTPGLTPEDASAIERTKALLGIGETYGRNIANEFYATGSLGRQSEELTAQEQEAFDRIKQFAAQVGQQTQSVKNLLSGQQSILNSAQGYSQNEQDALSTSKAALAGLDAQEMQGLRSQARQNIAGDLAAQTRQLAKAQARGQVFGAAGTAQRAQLGQSGVRETRNLERDLLVKNIDIKQAAQNQFNSLVTNTESNRAGRTDAASKTLSATTLGDEAQRNNAQLAADGQQLSGASSLADRLRSLREFNLNQAAAEKAGQVGSIFSGIGTVTGQRGLLAGEEMADKEFQFSQDTQAQIFDIINKALKQQKAALG